MSKTMPAVMNSLPFSTSRGAASLVTCSTLASASPAMSEASHTSLLPTKRCSCSLAVSFALASSFW
eukprot:CAMPEP_0180671964 /NCGR_PEP_ID=MMETSP1037_2-20121125/64870_1 /TAXON_ID=632150 /ORGANISM="Azadinium spinosum, Strain 3D9" /LENGTH=65 /DNA_ID=CAMNT_0022701057 /DNA_START=28 /DNA_END=222 /DNA_ORIENTATION=-